MAYVPETTWHSHAPPSHHRDRQFFNVPVKEKDNGRASARRIVF